MTNKTENNNKLENILKDVTLCAWKKSFLSGGTTFYDYKAWDDQHPLYKCTVCRDYLFGSSCKNYIPMYRLKYGKEK